MTNGSEAAQTANIIAFTSVINTISVESDEDDDLLFGWERNVEEPSISVRNRGLRSQQIYR